MEIYHPQCAKQGKPAHIVLRGNASLSARARNVFFLVLRHPPRSSVCCLR